MKKVTVETPFNFAENGVNVIHIEAGEQEVSNRCAEIILQEMYGSIDDIEVPEDDIEDLESKTTPEHKNKAKQTSKNKSR